MFQIKELLALEGKQDRQLGMLDSETQAELFKSFSLSLHNESKFFRRIYLVTIFVASIGVTSGIIWPLLLLSFRGYIS